jgi:hypothetical protein
MLPNPKVPLLCLASVGLAFTLLACEHDPAPAAAEQAPATTAAPSPSHDACGPFAALDALDPRTPVPLLPMMAWHQKQNMQEHLLAIQRITDGLAREDWQEIADGAALIATSPQMQQMCQHMGAGAEGFTELALDFHRRADAIGEAAEAHDAPAVLRATANTLQACTGCHAAFRQEVLDEPTWAARTGSSHDPMMMHGEH